MLVHRSTICVLHTGHALRRQRRFDTCDGGDAAGTQAGISSANKCTKTRLHDWTRTLSLDTGHGRRRSLTSAAAPRLRR